MLGFNPLASAPLAGDVENAVELSASDIVTSAPSVDQTTVSQVHSITLATVTAGAVSVGDAVISQVQVMGAASVEAQAPVVDSVDVDITHVISTGDILTGNPDIDDAVASLNRVLAVANLDTGPPAVASSALGQEHIISTADLASGNVNIDTANMAEDETFNTSNVFTGAVVVGSSSLQEIDPAPRMNAGYAELDYYDGAFDYNNPIPRSTHTIYSETNVNIYPSQFVVRDITETSSEISFYVYIEVDYVGPGSNVASNYKRKVTLEKGTNPFNVTLGSLESIGWSGTFPSTSLRTSTVDSSELRLFEKSIPDPTRPGYSKPQWHWEFDQSSSKRELTNIYPCADTALTNLFNFTLKSIFEDRAVLYRVAERNSAVGDSNNPRSGIHIKFFDNGFIDRPANVTQIIAAPLTGAPVVSDVQMITEHEFEPQSDLTGSAPVVDDTTAVINIVCATDGVVTGAPAVDDLDYINRMFADGVDAGVAAVDAASMLINHVLGGQDLYSQSPDVETTGITQLHVIDANDVTTLAADVPTANMAEYETFTTSSIYTQAPIVETSVIFSGQLLSADSVETGVPVVGEADANIIYDFDTNDVVTSAPSVEQAVYQEIHILLATGITTGSSFAETANMAEDETFSLEDVVTNAAEVEAGALEQHHLVSGNDVTTGNPRSESTDIDENHVFATSVISLGAVVVDTSGITQDHVVDGDDVETEAPVVFTAVITQEHDILATSVATESPQIDAPVFAQNVPLTASDITTGSPTVAAATVVAFYAIGVPDNYTGAPDIGDCPMSEAENFSAEDVFLGQPDIDEAEMIFSRNANMGDSENTVILAASLNLLSLTTDGRNTVQ